MYFYQHGKRVWQKYFTKFLSNSMEIFLHNALYITTQKLLYWEKYILNKGNF